MIPTDLYAIYLLQTTLIVFSGYAVITDARMRKLERHQKSGCMVEVVRGEISMTYLYTTYGASVAACLVLINLTNVVEGNKVVLIVIDLLCITYLFFFSSWFRNTVFFSLAQKVRKD